MGMDLTPDSRFQMRDILRPGPVIGVAGVLVLVFCIIGYAMNNHNVDLIAHPELASSSGSSIKYMVWMIGGVGLVLLGALLSFMDFSKR